MRQLLAPTDKYNYYLPLCKKRRLLRTGSSLLVISSFGLYEFFINTHRNSLRFQPLFLCLHYINPINPSCNDVPDHAAQKVTAIQNQGTSALKNVVAAKDTTLSAASAALEASAEADHHNAAAAWAPPAKFVHVSQWG